MLAKGRRASVHGSTWKRGGSSKRTPDCVAVPPTRVGPVKPAAGSREVLSFFSVGAHVVLRSVTQDVGVHRRARDRKRATPSRTPGATPLPARSDIHPDPATGVDVAFRERCDRGLFSKAVLSGATRSEDWPTRTPRGTLNELPQETLRKFQGASNLATP